MITAEELRRLKDLADAGIDRADLVESETVNIDPDAPVAERLEQYVNQIKNPYCFLYKGTVIRVRFTEGDQRLDRRLVRHLARLNGREPRQDGP